MLAYKIIVTVLDALFILGLILFKKEDKATATMALIMMITLAMNLGLVWN